MPTRILIVDDHPAVREGLAIRISNHPDLEVCGEASDVADALELVKSVSPDLIVVDVQLKTGDGLDLVKRIKSRDAEARILVWSMYPDELYAPRALRAGALGYINKENTTGRIIEAIRQVRDGKVYLAEGMAQKLLTRAVGGNEVTAGSPIDTLSDRELEIFRLIGDGLSTAEIAKRLHLSPHTIDTHRQRIKQKLNLETAAELTRAATRWMLDGE
ncbi:MAG TPA: response regulator transcription factor [Thermoguttaceae bacterium]|nr:response regulator transcription factor [Thermoguttaceae bacterium]